MEGRCASAQRPFFMSVVDRKSREGIKELMARRWFSHLGVLFVCSGWLMVVGYAAHSDSAG